MDLNQIGDFFKPLEVKERENLKKDFHVLFSNESFRRIVRDLFSKANPLTPSFKANDNYNSFSAAVSEGEKNLTRYFLKMLLEKESDNKPKKAKGEE